MSTFDEIQSDELAECSDYQEWADLREWENQRALDQEFCDNEDLAIVVDEHDDFDQWLNDAFEEMFGG